MIDKELLAQTVAESIKDTDIFIVDITIGADNAIVVELDSPEGIDIDTCAAITRCRSMIRMHFSQVQSLKRQ